MDPSEIFVENIKEKIPSILISKFETFDIKTLEEVLSINIVEFGQKRGVGKTVIEKLREFQQQAELNLQAFTKLQSQNTKTHLLPVNESIVINSNFLQVISEAVNDYLNILTHNEHRGIIKHIYGLDNSDKFGLDDLSRYYQLSRERIRQIRNEVLEELKEIFVGVHNSKRRCQIRQEVADKFVDIQKHLASKRVLSFDNVVQTFRDTYSCENASNYEGIIDVLIYLMGFTRCGKVESTFTKVDLIVVDRDYKLDFIKAADKTIRILKKKIVPLNEMQIIIEIKRSNPLIHNAQITDALSVLPEIEIVHSTKNQVLYQLKFEHLSSAADKAYRVLLEIGRDEMYIDDIVSEINSRLSHIGNYRIYDRHSLAIAPDKRFVSLGKTGYWTLKEWDKNTDKLENLVKTALLKLNKPSTYEEICEVISITRSNVKWKAIRTTTGRHCLKVVGDNWILPEWKQKYAHMAFVERKRRVVTSKPEYRTEQREQVIKYLDKKDGKKELSSQIIKDIAPLDKRYTRQSFYKLFEQDDYFIKDNTNRLEIKLRCKESVLNVTDSQYSWNDVRKK